MAVKVRLGGHTYLDRGIDGDGDDVVWYALSVDIVLRWEYARLDDAAVHREQICGVARAVKSLRAGASIVKSDDYSNESSQKRQWSMSRCIRLLSQPNKSPKVDDEVSFPAEHRRRLPNPGTRTCMRRNAR